MVIVGNATARQMISVGERLRLLVEGSALRDNKSVKVTVSVGAALAEKELSVEELVAKADQKLYMAKDGGRNQLVFDSFRSPRGLN